MVKNDPDEYCEAFRHAIREQGGLNDLLTKIYESLNEAINNPIMNEKITLQPFSPEPLEESLIYFDNKEEWRKRYGKYICI
jgi:hypothetical protein